MEDLAQQMTRIEATLRQANAGSGLRELGDDRVLQNMEHCVASAHAIYSSASTVVGSSTGSEFGNPLPDFRRQVIEDWVGQSTVGSETQPSPNLRTNRELLPGPSNSPIPSATHQITSLPSERTAAEAKRLSAMEARALGIEHYERGDPTKAEAAFRKALKDGNECNALLPSSNNRHFEITGRVDTFELKLWIALSIHPNNSSLEFEQDWICKVKLLDQHRRNGQQEMQKWQYKKAEKDFLKVLKLAKTLDINFSTRAVDLKDTKLMLALAYARERDPQSANEAVRVLNNLEDAHSAGSMVALGPGPHHSAEHTYLLASIHFFLDDLDLAQELCKDAIKRAVQAYGGPCREYHRAVSLMVAILFAKDETDEAKFWLEKVPMEYIKGEIDLLLSAYNIRQEELQERYENLLTWIPGEEVDIVVYLSKMWMSSGMTPFASSPSYDEVYRTINGESLCETPLHATARRGSLALTSMLLARKDDKNEGTRRTVTGYDGKFTTRCCSTPIQAAVVNHRQRIVELLLHHGADLKIRGYFRCATLDQLDAVIALGSTTKQSAAASVHSALDHSIPEYSQNQIKLSTIEMAIFALDGKIAHRLYQECCKKDPGAKTPLFLAINGLGVMYPSACISALIDGGAAMNHQEVAKFGSPLHIVIRNHRSVAICEKPKAAISPPNTMDNNRVQFEHWISTIRALAAAGAPVNEINSEGDTPLHVMCKTRHRVMCDTTSHAGWTGTWCKYVDSQGEEVLKGLSVMLEIGADVTIKDGKGQLPHELMLATLDNLPYRRNCFGLLKRAYLDAKSKSSLWQRLALRPK
jgi:tetratricopeptide (TPR) repeat protein/ankyrin repeat protein